MKKRLDVILTEKELFPSREKARAAIMAGLVTVNGMLCDKAGTSFDDAAEITVKGNACPYVSRGGFKLEKALNDFQIDLSGLICMDIGASTGGFTDCMLQHGASKVYAIDVGYGQLDWKLRQDPRVVTMERTNFRYLDPKTIPDRIDFASVDVSFISLNLILPVAKLLMSPSGLAVCLVKPQFEAGREAVGKNGVVKEPETHWNVLHAVAGYAVHSGFSIIEWSYSPIKGPKGNIEYLMYLSADKTTDSPEDLEQKISDTVNKAHAHLDV